MKTNKFLLLQACMMLFSFSAISQTTIYQAENKTAGQNTTVASSNAGFNGTGYVEMANANGNYFEWNNVSATSAGTADIRFRYTNSDGSQRARSCDIYVNGTNAGSYLFPWVNGGWAAWNYSAQVKTVNLNAGNNTIRVQINNVAASSPKIDEMEVVIGAPVVVNVTSVKVDPTNFALFVGQSATLKAIVLPSNATDKSVSWLSSNTNVVTVEAATGVVAGIASGTANVTATSTDGNIVGTCTVNVLASNTGTGTNLNLILNPGFEDAAPMSNWLDWGGFTTTNIVAEVATGINAASVPAVAGGFAQDVTIPALDAGKIFIFKVKAQTTGSPASAQIGCELYAGAEKINSPSYVTLSANTAYTEYTFAVATTTATTIARIWVYKTAAGIIFADDFSFAQAAYTPTDLNANSEVKTFCFLNSNNNQLSVKNNDGVQSVIIYNMNGQSLLNKTVNSKESTLNVSNLSNGLYIVKVNLQNGKTEYVKVLKK